MEEGEGVRVNKYDPKTYRILKGLQDKYPFLNFFYKNIPELTTESMRVTRDKFFYGAIGMLVVVIVIVVMTIHSLLTFEENPENSFVQNLGYVYYYTLVIAYFLPIYHILVFFLNLAWIYFKFN